MIERNAGEEVEARAGVVLGALVADAAAMGLHWLYDPERLAAIASERDATFLHADPEHFEGAKGVFVHDGKRSGDLSHYGATLVLAMDTAVAGDGRIDVRAYQKSYLAFFGPGGEWTGYIDRPTRGTLANLGGAVGDDTPDVSGIDDDQMPAFSTVPAVVAAGPERTDLEDDVARLVRVTNDNEIAVEGSLVLARTIRALLAGDDIAAALAREAGSAGDTLKPLLGEALGADDRSSVDVAGHFGRACHVPQGLPVTFHIAAKARSFESAIRANVLAGGDSCGRAMALGALLGAHFGFGGERGIPLPWLTRLAGGARLFDQAYRLASF